MVASYATEIAETQEAAGMKVNWPAEAENPDAPSEQMYPKEIWAAAQQQWQKLSPEEQEQAMVDYKDEVAVDVQQFESDVRGEAFKQSFSPWDLLWFGLAVFTAFKVGSGMASDD